MNRMEHPVVDRVDEVADEAPEHARPELLFQVLDLHDQPGAVLGGFRRVGGGLGEEQQDQEGSPGPTRPKVNGPRSMLAFAASACSSE